MSKVPENVIIAARVKRLAPEVAHRVHDMTDYECQDYEAREALEITRVDGISDLDWIAAAVTHIAGEAD
jgi:hypothetical protein